MDLLSLGDEAAELKRRIKHAIIVLRDDSAKYEEIKKENFLKIIN